MNKNLLVYKLIWLKHLNLKTANLRIQVIPGIWNLWINHVYGWNSLKFNNVWLFRNVISNALTVIFQKQTTKRKQPRMVFRSSFPCCNRCKGVSELGSDKNRTYDIGYLIFIPQRWKIRRLFILGRNWEKRQIRGLYLPQRKVHLFLESRFGERITTRGISQQLGVKLAQKYRMNSKVIYPHSFGIALPKLEKFNDISLLADLMGHEREHRKLQEYIYVVLHWNNKKS